MKGERMRYFQVQLAKEFVDAPVLSDWFGKIDVEAIKREEYEKIPFRTILPIRQNANVEYSGILSKPFFLVSEKIFDILKLFEPNLGYREVYLLDQKERTGESYRMPHLKRIEGKMDGTILYIPSGELGDTVIFKARKQEMDAVFMRLDLVEAILRREEYGLELEEVTVREME